MEKDPAIFEEINYYVTCDLVFPTISYIYTVKCVIVLAVINVSFGTGLLGINNTKFLKRYSPKEVLFSVAFLRNFVRRLTRSFRFV